MQGLAECMRNRAIAAPMLPPCSILSHAYHSAPRAASAPPSSWACPNWTTLTTRAPPRWGGGRNGEVWLRVVARRVRQRERAADAHTPLRRALPVQSGDCTLILTEGDSAKSLAVAGLAVVGRDYYGVFPLKGKLLNVREAGHKQVRTSSGFGRAVVPLTHTHARACCGCAGGRAAD
jgi:hypothetical protein